MNKKQNQRSCAEQDGDAALVAAIHEQKDRQQAAGIDWANLPEGERHKIYHSLRQEAIRRCINDPRCNPIYLEHLAACKAEIGYPEDSAPAKRGNRFAALKAKIGA